MRNFLFTCKPQAHTWLANVYANYLHLVQYYILWHVLFTTFYQFCFLVYVIKDNYASHFQTLRRTEMFINALLSAFSKC